MTIQSYKEDGRPSQQWFWDDWFSAFDVRLCSLAARGLWIDMLGIMFKAEIRGTLTVNGRQISNKTLANLSNAPSVGEMKLLLKELERNNVFSRLDDGTIYCRRMFKESSRKEEISRIRAKAGKKGAKKRWQNNSKENNENMAKMATSTSSPTPIPNSIPKEDTEILTHLSKVKNYPFNKEKDLKFIQGLKKEFPSVDILEKVKQICINWLNFPLLKKSRPRVQIKKWVTNEEKWRKERDQVGKSVKKPTKEEDEFNKARNIQIEKICKGHEKEIEQAKKEGDKDKYEKIQNQIKIELADWSREYQRSLGGNQPDAPKK